MSYKIREDKSKKYWYFSIFFFFFFIFFFGSEISWGEGRRAKVVEGGLVNGDLTVGNGGRGTVGNRCCD